MIRVATVAVVAACSGAPRTTIENHATGTAALLLQPGAYPCAFVFDEGNVSNMFRCVVSGDRIEKQAGMERFSGTLTPRADGVHLVARLVCTEYEPSCKAPFEVDLVRDAAGTFLGRLVTTDKDWWLVNQRFEITHAAFGGDQYGGAGYAGM
jgi:hypothetical protein